MRYAIHSYLVMACIVMAYRVMAYIVLGYMVLAYIVMAYIAGKVVAGSSGDGVTKGSGERAPKGLSTIVEARGKGSKKKRCLLPVG